MDVDCGEATGASAATSLMTAKQSPAAQPGGAVRQRTRDGAKLRVLHIQRPRRLDVLDIQDVLSHKVFLNQHEENERETECVCTT